MPPKDSSLYGLKRHKLSGDHEISSSTTLSFTSQLSSLIGNQPKSKSTDSTRSRHEPRARKDDIFTAHRATKKLKRDHPAGAKSDFEQKHATSSEGLDSDVWKRSKRKMEEKARLYAAIKRGDVEDEGERYAVDFVKKWAEAGDQSASDVSDEDNDGASDDNDEGEKVDYIDELGRNRTGTRAEAAAAVRAIRQQEKQKEDADRFTARPSAPEQLIYGDTIQTEAFEPSDPIKASMAALAAKRDRSATPPPDEHFDARKEVRNKGTGFYGFGGDAADREEQMRGLEAERAETVRRREERNKKVDARRKAVEERRGAVRQEKRKREADKFLDELGMELAGREGVSREVQGEKEESTEGLDKIHAAIQAEKEDDER